MAGGVWLNLGSAVVLPEVFLKAVAIARNLGRSLDGLTTANLDFNQQYRGLLNVLQRPGAEGIALTGHHELMIPLLHAAVVNRLGRVAHRHDHPRLLPEPGRRHGDGHAGLSRRCGRVSRARGWSARDQADRSRRRSDGSPWFDDLDQLRPEVEPARRADRGRRSGGSGPNGADLAVLFPNSFRSALMAWRSGAKRRVGYARGGRGLLLTDRLAAPRDRQGRLQADADRRLLPRDPPLSRLPGRLARGWICYTTPEDEAAADRAWDRLGLPRSEPVVCLNTGGAFGPAKSWPVGYFAILARRLVAEAGCPVLVVCGPGEREAARSIVRQADRPGVVSLAEEPMGIGLTKACIRRSSLLVTTDSGPRHFAVGFDVPVLTLFGPTHIGWTLTHHPGALHLLHPVSCGPCQRPICPEGSSPMLDISTPCPFKSPRSDCSRAEISRRTDRGHSNSHPRW